MKATSGLVMIVFLGLVSCFSPPEYPSVPEIEFDNVSFVETPNLADADTLKLSVRFKDGDGDIGLLADENSDDPQYAERYYFKVNDNRKYVLRNGGTSLDIANDPSFIRYKTKRTNSSYDTLPAFSKPFDCTNWEIVYKTTNNITSVVDTVYFKLNSDHYNIFVDFLVKNEATQEFEEYDFRKEYCTTYDGRIPILAKEQGEETPLQGTIRYAMIGTGFKLVFSIKPIKLRVQIQDRALNRSNVILSDAFTLDAISGK